MIQRGMMSEYDKKKEEYSNNQKAQIEIKFIKTNKKKVKVNVKPEFEYIET